MNLSIQKPKVRISGRLGALLRALPGRIGAGITALLALVAVLASSRPLATVAVVFALVVLAGSIYGILGSVLGVLEPVTTPLGRFLARLARPLTDLAARVEKRIEPIERRHVLLRIATWIGLVLATVGLLLAGVYLVSGWMGAILAGRTKPLALEVLYFGAFTTASVVGVTIAFWIAALGRLVFLARWRAGTVFSVALVAVCAGIGAMSTPNLPREATLDDQTRTEGKRPVDVLVALDPADPAVQEIAELVRTSRATLSRPRRNVLPYDLGIGLATPVDPALAGATGPWSVVEPPTPHFGRFMDSVAPLAPTSGRPARYEALLRGVRDDDFGDWRPSARRTVAVVMSKLPATTFEAGAPERLVVLTKERRRSRIRLWREWLARDGGLLVTYEEADATLFADIQDAATGSPVDAVRGLASHYAPRLRFDTDEHFLPVDVDDMLAKSTGHQVCEREWLGDDCRPVNHYTDLLETYGEYIDFEGGARLGQDLVDRDATLGVRRTMYVDAVERGDRLHLAYWWYMRYNVSPVAPERNCLPGLTFAEATCFDHEGDWEGVTVTLRTAAPPDLPDRYAPGRWEIDSVSFASHRYVTKWGSESLEIADGTHPVVYVAQGSHAAYPARCLRDCTQELAGAGGLPEGDFDGGREWAENATACCVPLPVTPDREGTLWNAFPGRWGKAVCTLVMRVCSSSDGPQSPSRQGRFSKMEGTTFRRQHAILAKYRRGEQSRAVR